MTDSPLPKLDSRIILSDMKYELAGSLLEFTRLFYKLRTGRLFASSTPIGRQSHFEIIAQELTKVIDGHTNKLIINVPPRHGKSEMLIHFIAWAMAIYPDSNFIYTSCSLSLARKQTQTIRSIMQLKQYKDLFGVHISEETSAKDDFETLRGGTVYGVGAGGTIVGRGAGLQGTGRYGGSIIIDDIHKPDEVLSDNMREGVIDWYYNTLQSRQNSSKTSIILIGQRLHEHDLPGYLIEKGDWKLVCLPALDEAGNALYPTLLDKPALLKMEKENPYVFAAQYQQNPQPAGGGLFKPEWFYIMPEDPEILATFITVDTAETSKSYNDASVFSFWGYYRMPETGDHALHWLDCHELRCEPKDLEAAFMDFYAECCRYPIKPRVACIEKKSTGVTLSSILEKLRGMMIRPIDRSKASGSKIDRFLQMQPFVASKLISFTAGMPHVTMVIEHMRKITANGSHRHDDIADSLQIAVQAALIERSIVGILDNDRIKADKAQAKNIMSVFKNILRAKTSR